MEQFPELKQPSYKNITDTPAFAQLRDLAHVMNNSYTELCHQNPDDPEAGIDLIGEKLQDMDELINPYDQPDLVFMTASAYKYEPLDGWIEQTPTTVWDKPLALGDIDMYEIADEMRVALRLYDEVSEEHFLAEPEAILRLMLLEQSNAYVDLNALTHRYAGEFIHCLEKINRNNNINEDYSEILRIIAKECSKDLLRAVDDRNVDVEPLAFYEEMAASSGEITRTYIDQSDYAPEDRCSIDGKVVGAQVVENDFLCMKIVSEHHPGIVFLVPLDLITSIETDDI